MRWRSEEGRQGREEEREWGLEGGEEEREKGEIGTLRKRKGSVK